MNEKPGRFGLWSHRFAYWRSLPWRCKLSHKPFLVQSWNENVPNIPEDEWWECARCSHFMAYVPRKLRAFDAFTGNSVAPESLHSSRFPSSEEVV